MFKSINCGIIMVGKRGFLIAAFFIILVVLVSFEYFPTFTGNVISGEIFSGTTKLTGNAVFEGTQISAVKSGNWNDVSVWSLGRLPGAGDSVVIDGKNVNFNTNTNIQDLRLMNGATLTASRSIPTRMNLSGSLAVLSGSRLDYGTATDFIPANVEAIIGFNVANDRNLNANTRPGPDPSMPSYQPEDPGLWTTGTNSFSSFYGAPKNFIWTKLIKDAKVGDTEIYLQGNPSGWRIGDTIMISPTGNEQNQTELRQITIIAGNKITLNSPLKYFHEGSLYAYNSQTKRARLINSASELQAGETLVPIQGEVALLTQNVKVQSNLVKEGDFNHRAHTAWMHGGAGSIAYSEFKDLGPRGQLGRYSIHLHKIGNFGNGFLIKGVSAWSSVSDPVNKWYVIHSTNGVILEDSVGYNAQGRGYYMEDADEIGNVVRNNLGVKVSYPEEVINGFVPLDIQEPKEGASVFWVREGNTVENNIASGGERGVAGFWITPNNNSGVIPETSFKGNEAHSNAIGFYSTGRNHDLASFANAKVWRNYASGIFIGPESRTTIENTIFFGNALLTGDGDRGTFTNNLEIEDSFYPEIELPAQRTLVKSSSLSINYKFRDGLMVYDRQKSFNLAEGFNNLTISETSKSGKIVSSNWYVDLDTKAPIINIPSQLNPTTSNIPTYLLKYNINNDEKQITLTKIFTLKSGNNILTVNYSDINGNFVTASYNVNYAGLTNTAPQIVSPEQSSYSVKEGEVLLLNLDVYDEQGEVIIEKGVDYYINGVKQGSLPGWVSFNIELSLLEVWPNFNSAGNHEFRFRIKDSNGAATEKAVILNVADNTEGKPMVFVKKQVWNATQNKYAGFIPKSGEFTIPASVTNLDGPQETGVVFFVRDPNNKVFSSAKLIEQGTNVFGSVDLTSTNSGIQGVSAYVWSSPVSISTPQNKYNFNLMLSDGSNQFNLPIVVNIIHNYNDLPIWYKTFDVRVNPVITAWPLMTIKNTVTLSADPLQREAAQPLANYVGQKGQWYLNDKPISSVLTYPFTFSFDTRQVPDGSYFLAIKTFEGTDAHGLGPRSFQKQIVIENVPGVSTEKRIIPISYQTWGRFQEIGSFVFDYLNSTGKREHGLLSPFPYTYSPPANTLSQSQKIALTEGTNWYAEPLTGQIEHYTSTNGFYKSDGGEVLQGGSPEELSVISSQTTDNMFSIKRKGDYFDGGRGDTGMPSGVSTLMANPEGKGWYGIDFNGRFFKVDEHGTITTIAGKRLVRTTPYALGTGSAANQQSQQIGSFDNNIYFKNPFDFYFDVYDPKIAYVADTGNHRIAKVDLHSETPVITTLAGVPGVSGYRDGPGNQALFKNPTSIVVSWEDGSIYVADNENDAIRRIVISGNNVSVTTVAGRGQGVPSVPADQIAARAQIDSLTQNAPISSAAIVHPFVIRTDSKGNLLFFEPTTQWVRRVNFASGMVEKVFKYSGPDNPSDWIWMYVDWRGNAGPKDDIFLATSSISGFAQYDINRHRISNAAAGQGITTDFSSVFLRFAHMAHGWGGEGGPVLGFYPWGIAIDDDESKIVGTASVTQGFPQARMFNSGNEINEIQVSNGMSDDVGYLIGIRQSIWNKGTVFGFPMHIRPGFVALYGEDGGGTMYFQDVPSLDDLTFLGDQELRDYIQSGMASSIPRPEFTGNDLEKMIYYVRTNSLYFYLFPIKKPTVSNDMRSPEVRNVKVQSIDASSAKITWQTDEPTLGFIKYGIHDGFYYGYSNLENYYSFDHELIVKDLPQNSMTHISVVVKDFAGNVANSRDKSFLTSTQTCSQIGGNVCSGQEFCSTGTFVTSVDTNRCCLGQCVTQTCGNNIKEGTEVCDSGSQACTINGYTGTQTCNLQCSGFNTCVTTQSCGDGIKNGNEQCDFASNNNNIIKSNTQNVFSSFSSPVYGQSKTAYYCSTSCNSRQETISGGSCGDNIINGNEVCDGNNLNGKSCITQGFISGILSCKNDCAFNTAQCSAVCVESWTCGAWSSCTNNQQTRTCTDSKDCKTTNNRPSLTQSCTGNSDRDVDGILDVNDKCPDLFGEADAYGCPKPIATRFDILSDLRSDLTNFLDFRIGISKYGKIEFGNNVVKLVKTSGSNYVQANLDKNFNFTKNKVEVNSSDLPDVNKAATITLFNISVSNPRILRDGEICSDCTIVLWDSENKTLVFTVPHFTTYEIVETPISDSGGDSGSGSSGGGGGSSGGGGGVATCSVIDWNCPSWNGVSCINAKRTRECISNCNTKRNETLGCIVEQITGNNRSNATVGEEFEDNKFTRWFNVLLVIIIFLVLVVIVVIIAVIIRNSKKREGFGFSDAEINRAVQRAKS